MGADEGTPEPSRARIVLATIIVLLTILSAWAVIEYRSQPPPPPNPVRSAPTQP